MGCSTSLQVPVINEAIIGKRDKVLSKGLVKEGFAEVMDAEGASETGAMAAESSGFFASVGGFLRKPARVSPPIESITSTARGSKR